MGNATCFFSIIVFTLVPFHLVRGEVGLSMDDRFQLSMSAEGEKIVGIDIHSPSGSLRPGTPNEAGPFNFSLHPTERHVTYANLGSAPSLDGNFPLPVRWNPTGVPDVRWQYGQRGSIVPIGFFDVFDHSSSPSSELSARLNEQNNFVISGTGQQLIGVSFQSPSGSLIPGPDGQAGPFDLVYANTAREISYGAFSNNNAITLDGDVTLPGAWNPVGVTDVTYHFNEVGPIHSGTKSLNIDRLEVPRVTVSIDDSFNFVLNGTGQRLTTVQFRSPGRSLLPAGSAAPFETLGVNTNSSIDFESSSPVTIDGNVTLDAGWDRVTGSRDVTLNYKQDGFDITNRLPDSTYPISPPIEDPLTARVDPTSFRLSLTGQGQELRTLLFTSRQGTLSHDGVATGPFDFVQTSRPDRVDLRTDSYATIDGTITLPISIDPEKRDAQFRYRQTGVSNTQGPFNVVYPPTLVPVRASVNDSLKVTLRGNGHELDHLEFMSEAGALVPGTDPEPFGALESNTSQKISFSGNATIDGFITLDIGWDEANAADLEFTYSLTESEGVVGPLRLGYPPANLVFLTLTPLLSESAFISGRGQEVISLEVVSPSESLVLLQDPNFQGLDIVEEYTERRIKLSATEPVAVDFQRLPFLWDPDGEADIDFTVTGAGPRAVTGRVIYNNGLVPEPSSIGILVVALVSMMTVRRRRYL